MRFLADENIEYPVISLLKENNIDVLAVRDIMKGATDSEILEYSFHNKLVIITSDKDFGELTFRLQKPSAGVILLRYPDADIHEKAKLLLTSLDKIDGEIANKFIVVDPFKIRIRKLL